MKFMMNNQRIKMRKPIVLFIISTLLISCAYRSNNNIKWDLTYRNILDESNIHDRHLIGWLQSYANTKQLSHYISPANHILKNWSGGKIISSFLSESPLLHAGEHHSILAIESIDGVSFYSYIEGSLDNKIEYFPKNVYRNALEQFISWEESKPIIRQDMILNEGNEPPGYFAVLNVFSLGFNRQVKISVQEYMGGKPDNSEDHKYLKIYLSLLEILEKLRDK